MIDKLKGAVRSLTIWFNGVLVTVIAALPVIQDQLPQVQQYVPQDLYRYLMLTVLVVNIMLRFKTNTGLQNK